MSQVAQPLPATTGNNQVAPKTDAPLSPSERFTAAVQREFASNNGELQLTSFQKKLIQNYFIKIDMILKAAEIKRLAKEERYRDPTPFTWEYVNIPRLANDVIAFSSVGLDPAQPNHINPIPYKNNSIGKYDITFIPGYRGIELKAKKYALDLPDDVVVELVYSNDNFKQIKKDLNNRVESYVFEVVDDFDRGELRGGFYYHQYFNAPQKNRLKVFSMKDILKRMPDKASAEFWGGEKDVWRNGQKVGKEEVEGWRDEMCYKTIFRAAYNSITIDSEKIDQNYLAVMQKEQENRDSAIVNQIANNSNGNKGAAPVGFDDEDTMNAVVIDTAMEQAANSQDSNGSEPSNDQGSEPLVVQPQTQLFNQPAPQPETKARTRKATF